MELVQKIKNGILTFLSIIRAIILVIGIFVIDAIIIGGVLIAPIYHFFLK